MNSQPVARPTVRAIDVPESARRLCTLAGVDYADAFLVEIRAPVELTGEQWARAVLEGAPPRLRSRLSWGWFVLGLRLGSVRSADLVLGWEVRRNTPDHVLLAASSRVGMPGELLFAVRPDGLLFATFLEQQSPIARVVWVRIAAHHRRVVRHLLARAGHAVRSDT